MGKIENVLFVCFGNTARSITAQGIADLLKATKFKKELKDVNFDSAGFVNVFKEPQPETKAYLMKKGMDPSRYRGKIMDSKMLEKQDLILVMETMHLKRLMKKFKDVEEIDKKAHLLLEFAGETENLEITDPVNFGPEKFQQVNDTVERGVIKSIEKILKMNKKAEK
jgi:protein-tyrosine-phosphatase